MLTQFQVQTPFTVSQDVRKLAPSTRSRLCRGAAEGSAARMALPLFPERAQQCARFFIPERLKARIVARISAQSRLTGRSLSPALAVTIRDC